MLQNGDTWGTTPRITVDTTQKAVEPKSGLASSRWASSHGKPTPVVLAASTANMEHPEQGSHKVDYQAADVNPDLKMDNGFSFTVTPSRISKMSTFNAPTAQSEDEFWGGAVSQHQFDSEVAMVDGDGDVVMMDLNDPGTIMMVDQVARDERQAETGGYADWKPGFRPSVSSPRISNPSCVLVIDTSFILSHLQLVDNLVRSHSRWRNVVVMPWATILELDGLKNSRRQNDGIDVSKLARSAINWAYGAFGKRDPGVWGQVKEEKYDNDATHGDPAILDCCRYFHRIRGHNTVLLTHDKNLGVQAMMNSIGIVQMNGSTLTAESILSRLGLHSANPRVAPLPNEQPTIDPPAKNVPIRPACWPADTDHQKAQPSFYPTVDADSPYLQYGTKRMETTPPKTSAGLQDSIYAHGNGTTMPKPQVAKFPLGQPTSLYYSMATAQNGPRKSNAEIKTELNGLLQEISRELITNLVPLLRKCTLEKLGDADTLRHLNIMPEKQVHKIIDIERFFVTHWMTVFTEIFPRNLQQVFGNGYMNQRHAKWVYWAEFGGPDAGPGKVEIRRWIEEWDFIWKRLIYTEKETMINMDTVDRWRNALAKMGLFD